MTARPLAAVLAIAAALAASACQEEQPRVPVACREGEAPVKRALEAAPGEARLPDGTRLSACVRNARDDAELQEIGLLMTSVAEDLEVRAARDPKAALQLGYLIGAARRGAPGDSGPGEELVYRLERSALLDGAPPEIQRAVREGMAAGRARG